jgi:hypothetical protein
LVFLARRLELYLMVRLLRSTKEILISLLTGEAERHLAISVFITKDDGCLNGGNSSLLSMFNYLNTVEIRMRKP